MTTPEAEADRLAGLVARDVADDRRPAEPEPRYDPDGLRAPPPGGQDPLVPPIDLDPDSLARAIPRHG